MRAAIDGLGAEQRSVVLLREIEGLSYEEIASVLEIPVGTVRSRLYNARVALAERLLPPGAHEVTRVECTEALERLSAAMDGELAPPEALAVEQHVRACASCARAQVVLAATRSAIALPAGRDGVERIRRVPARAADASGQPESQVACKARIAAAGRPGRRAGSAGGVAWTPQRSGGPPPACAASDGTVDGCDGAGLRPHGSSVLCRIDAPCADARSAEGRARRCALRASPVVEAW